MASYSSMKKKKEILLEISESEESENEEEEENEIQKKLNIKPPFTARGGGQRGFLTSENRSCTGAIARLQACFYSNFKPFKIVRRKHASSCVSGELFHRQVYHTFVCQRRALCSCMSKFGKKTLAIRKGSMPERQINTLRYFLRTVQWQVLTCELVVGWEESRCATAIDVVCVDNLDNPTKVFIVELKTGYHVQRKTPRTVDGTKKMTGEAVKDIDNSFANHHQLQLWFCAEALKRSYDIQIAQGVVLYIHEDGGFDAEYAASWWFKDLNRQILLIRQFSK